MPHNTTRWDNIKHLRFTAFLSTSTLELLKEQVYRILRDQEKDSLYEDFMNWQRKENEIILYSDYCLHGFDLPTSFNSIAKADFPAIRTTVYVVIPYSIINGWATINKIERGHRHVCLLQFDDKIPEIIKGLPEVNGPNRSSEYEVVLFDAKDFES